MADTTPVHIIVEQLELIAMHLSGVAYRKEHTMKTVEQTQQLTLTATDARLLFPAIEQAAIMAKGRGDEDGAARLWAMFHAIDKMHFYKLAEPLPELSEHEPIVAQLKAPAFILTPDEIKSIRQGFGVED